MKKKTLTIAIALVLVVALAVGATWAYLTSTTNTITNTFVAGKLFDQGGIKLQERVVTQKNDGTYVIAEDAAWQDTGIEYVVQPGVDLPKQPAVKVNSLTAKAYLFVGVKGDKITGKFDWNVDTAIWSPLMNGDTQVTKDGYTIWVLKADVTDGSYDILANDKVTVGKDLDPDTLTAANNITFQAYICQAAGFDTPLAAFNECF